VLDVIEKNTGKETQILAFGGNWEFARVHGQSTLAGLAGSNHLI